MPSAPLNFPVGLRAFGIFVSPILIFPFLSSLSFSKPFPFENSLAQGLLGSFNASRAASIAPGKGFCGTNYKLLRSASRLLEILSYNLNL